MCYIDAAKEACQHEKAAGALVIARSAGALHSFRDSNKVARFMAEAVFESRVWLEEETSFVPLLKVRAPYFQST